jgi:hypothetical protein
MSDEIVSKYKLREKKEREARLKLQEGGINNTEPGYEMMFIPNTAVNEYDQMLPVEDMPSSISSKRGSTPQWTNTDVFNLPESKPFKEYEAADIGVKRGSDYNKELDQYRYENASGLGNLLAANVNIGVGTLFGAYEGAAHISELLPDWMQAGWDPFKHGAYGLQNPDIPYDYDSELITWLSDAKAATKDALWGGTINTRPVDHWSQNLTSPTSWIATASDLGESIGGFMVTGMGAGSLIKGGISLLEMLTLLVVLVTGQVS